MNSKILISVIVPVHNGAQWINPCLESIFRQNLHPDIALEVCIYDDASTDDTYQLIKKWELDFFNQNIYLKLDKNNTECPKGVGYAKNRAVNISRGEYLCFQDIDDLMLPMRVNKQYEAAKFLPQNTLIGSQFSRNPPNSTVRYTKWANSLAIKKLDVQIYTSHGPTVIMPTWFCHRSVFERVGGFSEDGKGTPEDLIFFYRHLDLGGKLYRVDEPLVIYTYHLTATTFSINKDTIWKIRLHRLERFLEKWEHFTIWNAGKQGRKFYNSLSEQNQQKVTAFCDVDIKKVGSKYRPYDAKYRRTKLPIDIIHFSSVKPPIVICIKMDLSNGDFEFNLQSLNLEENKDYILFS